MRVSKRLLNAHNCFDWPPTCGGAVWEQEINTAISRSSFMIPIVTPGFLQSEWCCKELLLFRELEKELGRSDLIFPILYITTDDIDPDRDDQCFSPEVFRLLRSRQQIDLRDLRFGDVGDSDVSRRLGGLAKSIRAALGRSPVQMLPFEQLETVAKQEMRGYLFGGDDGKPISIVEPRGAGLTITPDQRQGHGDVRDKAARLIITCGSSNRLSKIKGITTKLLSVCGISLEDLQPRAFWSQMNSLRRIVEADDLARAAGDDENAPLPFAASSELRDLVNELNLFSAGDAVLIEFDLLMIDPAQRNATSDGLASARTIAEASKSVPAAVSPETANALGDLEKDSFGDGPSSLRAGQFLIRSVRNLCLEAIRRTYKAMTMEGYTIAKGVKEGAYRAIGGVSGLYLTAMLIKSNEVSVRILINSLGGAKTLHTVVDAIVKYIQ